jgi:hypothetical protein
VHGVTVRKATGKAIGDLGLGRGFDDAAISEGKGI